MSKHNNSVSALAQVADNIQTTMDEKKSDIIVCTKKQTANVLNQFVFLFVDNFDEIINRYNLKLADVRVIMQILKIMQYGNLVSTNFSIIGKNIGMDRSNINKVKKRLLAAKVLVETNNGIFVNPHIIAKGNFADNKNNKENVELLNKAYEAMQGTTLTPSILTEDIKAQERSKGKQKKVKKEIERIINEPKSEQGLEEDIDNILEKIKYETNPLFEKQ